MRIARAAPIHILSTLLIILPPAAVLRIILVYGRSVPWMDQWHIPARIFVSHLRGTLAFSDFFQIHNESVKAFSGLIWFLLARTGWNPRNEMVLAWCLTAALAVVLHLLLRRTLPGRPIVRHAMVALMVLFLFNPHGVSHWLTGLNLENILVIFFLAAGLLINSWPVPSWLKYLLAAGLSFAATFSYANGMLLWILICPALPLFNSTPGKSGLRSRLGTPGLFYLAAGLASLFCYFSIISATQHKVTQGRLVFDDPAATVIFLLHWLGAPFSLPGAEWTAPCAGALFLLLFLVPLISHIRSRRRGEESTALHPWLLLGSYTLLTGVVVAVGRQSLGLETALAPRYFMHPVLLPMAILPLAFLMSRGRSFHALYLSLASLMALYCAITVIGAWAEAEATARASAITRDRGTVALSFIRVIPRNPELAFLSLHPTALNANARPLMQLGILDVPLHSLLPTGRRRPPEKRIRGLRIKPQGERGAILVSGHCPVRHSGGEITHLLLTSIHGQRPEKAFAVITPKLSGHPLPVEKNTDESVQFLALVGTQRLEQGVHLLKVWSYDASSGEYTPLVREWEMHHEADGLCVFPAVMPERAGGAGQG